MNKIKFLNARRCVAVFMAMLITVLSFSYTNNNRTNATNSNITYFVYDAKTGDKIPNRNYMLLKLNSSDKERTVIGNEDRKIDWSKSGVAKIITEYTKDDRDYCGLGSGFVVSDHVIATAAHCINGRKISEILLFSNNGNTTLHATPIEYHVPYLFTKPINSDEPYNYIYDYALIMVKEDLSAYACFDLGVPLDNLKDKHSTVSVTGFPGKVGKPNEEKIVNTLTEHKMYTGKGTIVGINNDKISYDTDSTGGNSGGPAYITEKVKDNEHYTVIAIHSYSGTTQNGGVRMTTDLIHFYKNNKNINWEVS